MIRNVASECRCANYFALVANSQSDLAAGIHGRIHRATKGHQHWESDLGDQSNKSMIRREF
jgi:hypothetical protein